MVFILKRVWGDIFFLGGGRVFRVDRYEVVFVGIIRFFFKYVRGRFFGS